MRIQLDSEKKTIKIEGNVKLSELVKHLESLLPKDCKLGYWKDYELECNTIITYLMVVCSVMVQKIQERPPRIKSGVMSLCAMMALKTYSGEVPMSPKIIPNAINNPPADTFDNLL